MINYKIIDDSIIHYESAGFKRIESPWTVSREILDLTKPVDKIPYQLEHNKKCLVGSGEQSFLYLYLKGFLPYGRFQTVTPCFRDEEFGFLHTKYFMKNELIITDIIHGDTVGKMVNNAIDFLSKYLDKDNLRIVSTEEGYDILYKQDELGSYGIRKSDFLVWIYGTGVAEPRLSMIMNKYGISHKRNTEG